MILKRIAIKRLKAIGDRTIDFSPGVNIIKGGDNEVGKSSLRIAITKALFEDPSTTRKEILGLTSWGADELWEVALEFQTDSKSYRITKSLRDKSCQLIDASSSKIIATEKNAITARIAELTGCPSEVFFESTTCIGQEELIGIIPQAAKPTPQQEAMGTITQRLQATLSGMDGVDVPTIVSRLRYKTHRKDAKGPYWHLQTIEERMKRLEANRVPQKEKVDKIVENRKELNRVKEDLDEIGKDLPPKQELVEKNNKILELEEEIERDKTQYSNFKRAEKFKASLENLDKELEQRFTCFVGAEEEIKRLNSAKNELQNLGKQKAGVHEDKKVLQEQRPAFWMLLLGLALVVVGMGGFLIATKYLGIVAIVGLLLSGYWWLILQRDWSKQMESMSDQAEELEQEIQSNDKEIERILSSFGFQDYYEYQRQFADYQGKVSERKETQAKLAGIMGDGSWDRFKEENSDLDIQVSAKQKELRELLPFKLDPLALQKMASYVEAQKKRADQLEKEKGGLERFFDYTDVDTDQLATIEEELRWLGEEREFWERRVRVFEITREALDEAHKETLSKAADVLEKELGSYISTITGGRYSQVKIDESDLSIWTFSPEKADWVNVRELSRATQDQFYICARFALVKLITEGKRPPLLLDDPFVNFHPTRVERTIPLLQELAKENQILLFTCSNVYDGFGKVISLE